MADKNTWQVVQTAPFIGGLNTEVNDLQDATQYTSDELNMVIKNNGTRARRLGIDYEESFKFSNNTVQDFVEVTVIEDNVPVTKRINIKPAFSACEWTDIADNKNDDYIVVQIGPKLFFYENLGAPFSQAQTNFEIDLADYKLSTDPEDVSYAELPVSFTNAYGGLFVCSKAIHPFVLKGLSAPVGPVVAPTVTIPLPVCYWAIGLGGVLCQGLNPELRFLINDVVAGLSQLRGDSDVYYSYNDMATYPTQGPFFGPYQHSALVDDFGNAISDPLAVFQWYPYSGSPVMTDVLQPTANYYADLWNYWESQGLTQGITAVAVTPFSGYWVDWNALTEDQRSYYYGKIWREEPIESLAFVCPANISYENTKITLESIMYVPQIKEAGWSGAFNFTGLCNRPASRWGMPPLITNGFARGYKTPNIEAVLDIKIRDFKGLKDIYTDANLNTKVDLMSGEGVSTEPELPSSLGQVVARDTEITNHCYNLFNQGWNYKNFDAFRSLTKHTVDGVEWCNYPANSYQWFLSKDSSTLAFKPADLIKLAFGNTRAPNGRAVLSYLKQDRKAAMDSVSDPSERITVTSIPIEYPRTPYFVDIIAYAGRVWYLSGDTVLYSQVLFEDLLKAERCYQEADPTSEEISDIVDTDGGMIQIPELGEGVRFCLVGSALAVVGTRSIQLISGGQNNAFTATAYTRGAMQAYTTVAPRSFVTTEFGTFFWSDVGIVLLSYQDGFAAQNITENTINTFYQRIPDKAKESCVGVYNRAQKQIVWMYSEDEDNRNLRKMLIFDVLKNSWTPFEIASREEEGESQVALPWVVGGIPLQKAYKVDSIYPIYAEVEEQVTPDVSVPAVEPVVSVDENGDNIGRILADDPIEKEEKTFKSAVLVCFDRTQQKITFGNFDNLNCLDWAAGDLYGPGVNYNSYLVSHPINLNSTAWNKTMPYILSYFRRTETGYTTDGVKIYPSACQGAVLWDWNNSGKAGKWDAQQELYRYEKKTLLVNDYVFSKTRVYGGGRAFKVKLSSKDNNYFIVENIGFNLYGDARI